MNGISIFFANAAFFYFIYWLSMLVVRAGPALLTDDDRSVRPASAPPPCGISLQPRVHP
jgi:hypothetical protein